VACEPEGAGRRRLAFVYHPYSFGTMAVAEAARAVCELIWIVDTTQPEVASMSRMLRRLGELIDVAGMSVQAAAEAVEAARPDGILALADSQLQWTADLAERLGLLHSPPAAAAALMDKFLQRTALHAGGLPVPGFWLVPDRDEDESWKTIEGEIRFPALLKPRAGHASRDVVKVASLEALQLRLGEVGEELDGEQAGFVIEEYLEDRPSDRAAEFAGYVSVESIVSGGQVSHLAVTGRFPLAEPFRETGFFIPSALADQDRDAVLAVASAAIAAIGVSVGCLHTEIKLTPDGPRVIEVNGRIGGGVPEMLAAITDIELLAIAMRLALGELIVFEALPVYREVGYLLYVQAPATMRRVLGVEGLEQLRADPNVELVILNHGPGYELDWRKGNQEHVFSVLGAVNDHQQLKLLRRRVLAETRISGE
jgi:biotin carboxylase